MRYGFVIDQRKCIGCHACTVACKEENQVPLGRQPHLGEVHREGDVPRHAALLLRAALQPLRQRALRDHLPHGGALPPPRRHRRLRRRPLHRLQVVHAGLPVRRALHRSGDQDRGQVPLLRPPGRGRARAGVRGRVPGAGHRRPATSTIRAPRSRGSSPRSRSQVRKPEQGTQPEAVLPRRRRRGADAADAAPRRGYVFAQAPSIPAGPSRTWRAWSRAAPRTGRAGGSAPLARTVYDVRARRAAVGLEGLDLSVDEVDRGGRAAGRRARRRSPGGAAAARRADRARGAGDQPGRSCRSPPCCSSSISSGRSASSISCSSPTGARGWCGAAWILMAFGGGGARSGCSRAGGDRGALSLPRLAGRRCCAGGRRRLQRVPLRPGRGPRLLAEPAACSRTSLVAALVAGSADLLLPRRAARTADGARGSTGATAWRCSCCWARWLGSSCSVAAARRALEPPRRRQDAARAARLLTRGRLPRRASGAASCRRAPCCP